MRSRRVGGSSYTFVVQSRRIPLCFINFMHKSSFNSNSVIPIDLTSSVHLCIVTAFRGSISAFGFSNLVSVCRCDQPGGSRNPKSACVCDSDLHLRLGVCTAQLRVDGLPRLLRTMMDAFCLLACCESAPALRCRVFRGQDRIGWCCGCGCVGTVPCVGLDRVSHQRVWRASGGVFSRPSVFPRGAHARQHGPMKNRGGVKKKDGSTVTGRA